MADTPKLKFNKKEYDVAALDTWTLDEALVLYEYAKLTLDQIDDNMGFHPGVIGALIHVSVKRAEPKAPEKSLRAAIGGLRMMDLREVFEGISVETDEEEGDADGPPAEPPQPSGGDSSSGNVTPLSRRDDGASSETPSEPSPEHNHPGSSGDRSSAAAESA